MMYNYKAFLRRSTAVLLAAALMLSNIINGVGAIDGYAYGTNWSIDSLGDSYDDESLYEEVQKMYCTDLYGLPASEQEIWSQGSMDDIEVEYDTLNYADDMSSADVRVYVIPRDENVKISGVRQAGYFGDDNIATSSNAIATASDASDSNATGYAYDFTIFNNKPAFVIYYTVAEDADGDAVATDSEADTDHEESYVWVSAYDELTDIGVVLSSGIVAPELSANLVDLYHAYTAADTTALTDMLTAGVTDEAGNKIDNLTIDTTELGQFFEGITVSADMSAELTTNGYTADIAGLVAYYDATIAAATEGADTTDPTVKEQIDAFKKDIYATAFADYMGQKTSVVISRSDDTSATRSIVIATEVSSITKMNITVPANKMTLSLSQNNTTLKNESDFEIGKAGTAQFAITATMNFDTLQDTANKNRVAFITIPEGFTYVANGFTSSQGETYQKTHNSDGTETLRINIPDSISTTLQQEFQIAENAQTLINGLPDTAGTYNFTMQVYSQYGQAEQELISVNASDENTDDFTLQADTSKAALSIDVVSGKIDDTWHPNEVVGLPATRNFWAWDYWNVTQTNYTSVQAAQDAHIVAQAFSPNALYSWTITKTKGYLPDDFVLNWSIPGVTENWAKDNVKLKATYTTEDGTKFDLITSDVYDRQDTQEYKLAEKSNTKAGSVFYTLSNGQTYAEALYGPGTITVNVTPIVYPNKIYNGDWNNTAYTAATPISVSFTGTDGSAETFTGDKLHFKLINGTDQVKILSRNEIQVTSMPQYTAATPRYNDSEWQNAIMQLSFYDNWQFLDNLLMTYDYEQALSPVELANIRATKECGMTYRIYVKDATTDTVTAVYTIVDEESYEAGYTPQMVDGVTETVLDGATTTEWKLPNADSATNTTYVSKIEVSRDEYEYNVAGTDGRYSNWQGADYWFSQKLRAYHAQLSDGTDIPGGYQAKITATVSADQLPEAVKEYKVTTQHLSDNISIAYNVDNSKSSLMEINSHKETGFYFRYHVSKYTDTMEYNVDTTGKTIAYGETGYNPVVVELAGDGITVVDRMGSDHQKPIGIWGDDGHYYDLQKLNIDADDYLISATGKYSDTKETYSGESDHANGNGGFFYSPDTQLYNLKSIYDKLGINYASKIVVAITDINDWIINGSGNRVDVEMILYVNKIYAGYLNYNNVINITDASDAPVSLMIDKALYCEYSDYVSEAVDGGAAQDSNGGTVHGTAKSVSASTATITYGTFASGASLYDDDHYVNPYTKTDSTVYTVKNDELQDGKETNTIIDQDSSCDSGRELTRINIDGQDTTKVQLDYSKVTIDFDGTDPKLLSLTNAISLQSPSAGHDAAAFNIELEYTLNGDSTVHTVKDVAIGKQGTFKTMYYAIPDVDIENGKYITSLKVSYSDGVNWGKNTAKYGNITGSVHCNMLLSAVGLAISGSKIPDVYPADPSVKVGETAGFTHTDTDGTAYDKLKVQAAMTFSDCNGKEIADGTGSYLATGLSDRLAGQKAYVDAIESASIQYYSTSTYQNETFDAITQFRAYFSDATAQLGRDNDIQIRPTIYYKVAKGFTYVDGSLSGESVVDGLDVRFISAGTGTNQSGSDDYGLIKISYDNVKEEDLPKYTFGYIHGPLFGDFYARMYNFSFKLMAQYNAPLGERTPVSAIYYDTTYDANRDGSYEGNSTGFIVETADRDGTYLSNDAPYGIGVDNITTAKLDADGKCVMLKANLSTTHTVLEKIITGILPYVTASAPEQESLTKVTSKDITAIDDLYGYKVYLTGDTTSTTKAWEVYVPVSKKGETVKYNVDGQTKTSEANDFSMDFNGIDTSDLVLKALNYKIYYTTDANPGGSGYTSMSNANWTLYDEANPPTNKEAITGIKVWVDELIAKDKAYFHVDYKLHEDKSVIGDQNDYTMTWVNFKVGEDPNLKYGTVGNNWTEAQIYNLTDMSMTGFVWDESDYNSTYNDGETKVSGVTMDLYDTDGTTKIEQTGNAAAITNANGAYTLIVPHDGTVNVKINLPDGKKLVNKQVNSDATIDSAFDRDTQNAQITFVANAIKNAYNCPDVNAGIYDKPVINVTVVPEDTHIVDGVSTAQVDVDNKVPGTTATFTQDTATGDYTITDNGDETATVSTGKLTGVYYGKSSIDDGYGGTEETTFPIVIYNNVKYDANTGTGTPVTDNKHYYPSTAADGTDAQTDVATVKDDTGISKTGYTFAGWATTASATAADYQPGDTTTLGSVTGDVTLYAVWTANQYTVKYLANDLDTAGVALDYAGTANTTSADGTTADSVHTYDVAKKLTKNGYSIPGYTWVEWNLAKNGTSTSFTDEQSVINLSSAVDGVVYMNAQWRAHQYEVIFDGNGAKSGSTANENFTYGTAKNLNTNGFARPGYIFMGWNTASDSNAALYTDGQSVKNLTTDDNGKVTLYAIWAEKDDVVINYVSADAVMGSVSLASEALKPATGVATGSDAIANPGYTFVEWQQTTDGQPVATPTDAHIIPQKDADELNVSGTYTAVFRENTYTVKFDKNGADGTETMGSMNLTYTELIKLLKNMYTNSGYMFGGWNTEADGSGQSFMDQAMIDKLTTDDAGVVTLYAQWIDTDAVITQDPPIKKIVTKAASSQDLAAGEDYTYKFSMVPSPADAPMPVAVVGVTELQADGSLLATITGAAEGTYGVEFGDMTYTKPGTYSYTLSEVKGENTRFTYDTNTYTMTVVISWEDAARTKLQKTVTYTKADGTVVDSMDFTNEYNRPRQNSSGDDSSSSSSPSSPAGGQAVGDSGIPSGAGASIGGGSDLFGIGPDGIPLNGLIINGIPKTGEEWAHAWMYLLMITGLFGAAIALIKRRRKTN